MEELTADRTVVRLINTSVTESRSLLLQAGAFGEHRFTEVGFETRASAWPGDLGGYAGTYSAEPITRESRRLEIDDGRL